MFHVDGKLEDVATDGIGDFDFGGRVGEFTGVARRLEVVEERGGEHGESIAASRGGVEGRKRRGMVTQRSQRRGAQDLGRDSVPGMAGKTK